jgi:hypothetical protein
MGIGLNALVLRLEKNNIGIPCSTEVAYHENEIKLSNRPTLLRFRKNIEKNLVTIFVKKFCE